MAGPGLVDQIGGDYAGDRMAALDEVERQLRLALRPGQIPGDAPADGSSPDGPYGDDLLADDGAPPGHEDG